MGACIRQDRGLMHRGQAADQGQWENKFVSNGAPISFSLCLTEPLEPFPWR